MTYKPEYVQEHEHHHDFEYYEEDDSFKKKTNKFFLVICSIIIILLMLSYSFFSGPTYSIIEGKFESDLLINKTINSNNLIIFFENNTDIYLENIYLNSKADFNETSLCLNGYIINKDIIEYYITNISHPKILEQSYTHVSFEPCSSNSLIMLHTHPYQHCLASDTDFETFNKLKKLNSNLLMMIMCEEQRYSIYS